VKECQSAKWPPWASFSGPSAGHSVGDLGQQACNGRDRSKPLQISTRPSEPVPLAVAAEGLITVRQ